MTLNSKNEPCVKKFLSFFGAEALKHTLQVAEAVNFILGRGQIFFYDGL